MKLVELQTENVDGARDATYSFRSGTTAAPLVVVTGPARSGRTRFVRALVATKETVASYAGGLTRLVHPADSARLIRSRLTVQDDDATNDLDRVLSATHERHPDEPLVPAHDPRLLRLLETFEVGRPTPKMWLFDETTGSVRIGRGLKRMPSIRDLQHAALGEGAAKQGYVRALLADLVRADGIDVAAELEERGAVIGGASNSRRVRLDEMLNACGVALHFRGSGTDGSLAFERDGRARELSELSVSERRAVVVSVTALYVDLTSSIVIADGLADGPDAAGWVAGLRALCPRGQLIVTALEPGAWASGAVVVRVDGARA